MFVSRIVGLSLKICLDGNIKRAWSGFFCLTLGELHMDNITRNLSFTSKI